MGGSPSARGRSMKTTRSGSRDGTTACSTASTCGAPSIAIGSLVHVADAAVVISVIVQQQAARTEVPSTGAFCLAWCVLVGQQQADRVTPSYAQWYQDAVAVDGITTSKSISTMRRMGHSIIRTARR